MATTTVDRDLCHATAAWLTENVDSHGIYGTDILDSLPDGVSYDAQFDKLVTSGGEMRLYARPLDVMEQTEGALTTGNPKGAYIDDEADRSVVAFGGHELSAKLDRLLTGEDAGGDFFGRGSAHRARVEHLAKQ